LRYFVILILIVSSSIIFTLPQTFALSCAIPQFTESYDRHDLLLHGKLVEKELLFPESENQKMTALVFDTIKVYKGDFSKTITVTANLSWDDYYREGQEYVLFADKDGDGYLREVCVGDYVSSPSIIKFLDEFLLDPTIGDDVLSLYDVVRGFEADDLDIRINKYSSLNRGEMPVPEPDDNPHLEKEPFCGKGTTYNEGICIVDQPKDESIVSSGIWGTVLEYPVSSPLKQIKNGVALIDVKCNEGKYLSYKSDRMRVACVSEETQSALWHRGWATMRLIMQGENISHALCNNYEGKWHPEYDGCRDVTDLQCSLMGGEFVDDLKICYNGICPVDKTYTLCVTNPDIWDFEPFNKMTLWEDPFFNDPDKFAEINEKKDTLCFTTPSMNYFCYAKPRMLEEGHWASYLISNTTKITGEVHFDNVNVGPSYFTIKNMTQIKGDTARITFADNDYRVGNATSILYEITDDFEFTEIIEKFDTFVAKCDNYEGTSVTVVQYLGITTIDGVDYFMTWHLNANSEDGIACEYPQIIKHSFGHDFGI